MDLQLIIHQVMQDDLQLIRQEQARRLAYSVSLTTAAYNAPTSLPASLAACSARVKTGGGARAFYPFLYELSSPALRCTEQV